MRVGDATFLYQFGIAIIKREVHTAHLRENAILVTDFVN